MSVFFDETNKTAKLEYGAEQINTKLGQIEDLETKKHTHSNQTVIDKLSEVDGQLKYDGNAISGGTSLTEEQIANIGKVSTIEADVTTLETTVGNKVDKVDGKTLTSNDFTNDYKTKLDGLQNYTLPTATTDVLGGVKVDGTSMTIDSDGTIHSTANISDETFNTKINEYLNANPPSAMTDEQVATSVNKGIANDSIDVVAGIKDGSVTNVKIGGQLNTYTTKNATTRFKEINVMDININTTENTISYNTKRTGSIYVNNTNPTIVKANETKSVALKDSTTFVLAYNPTTNSLDLNTYGYSLQTCIILAYIYYHNANLVRLALCGNDNSIAVYKDGIQLYDMQTEQSIFNHTANSKASVWSEWATNKIDKTTTPVPFSFNSSVYANGGMFVGRAGDCNMWNTYDNGKGGHAMQLFSKDKSYRFSVVLDDRLSSTGDNLPVTALHTWLTDGGKEYAFGWLHLGADMCGFVNGVNTGQDTGIYVNPSMSIFNTPTIMKPQPLVTNMPKGYQVDENGNYLYDSEGKRIPKDLVGIDGKDILQVNENHELCFHRGDTNKWYKVNMTEITE